MDDIPDDKLGRDENRPAPATTGAAGSVRRPDGRVLRPVAPEGEVRGGAEAPAPPDPTPPHDD